MSNELSTVNPNLPAYMQEDARAGLEDVGRFMRPSWLKVVQPTSKPPLNELFAVGDVVLTPQNVAVSRHEGSGKNKTRPYFKFTPLLFWPEWLALNPREAANLPMIRERSRDPKSSLARKCQDPNKWYEACPEYADKPVRNVECLNYIIVVHDIPAFAGLPILLSFSKSEHKTGSNFNSALTMRRAGIFSTMYEATTSQRQNEKGQWWGLDITTPDEGGWVPEGMYAQLKAKHEELKQALKDQLIDVQYDDETVGDPVGAAVDAPF